MRKQAPFAFLVLVTALFTVASRPTSCGSTNGVIITVAGYGSVASNSPDELPACTGDEVEGVGCFVALRDIGTVTLTATPAGGSVFDGWDGDCASAATNLDCTITAAPDTSFEVTARFAPANPDQQ